MPPGGKRPWSSRGKTAAIDGLGALTAAAAAVDAVDDDEPPPLEPQGAAVPDGLADVLGMMRHQLVATRRTTRTKMRPASCTTSGADGAPGEDEEETGDELLTDAGLETMSYASGAPQSRALVASASS